MCSVSPIDEDIIPRNNVFFAMILIVKVLILSNKMPI